MRLALILYCCLFAGTAQADFFTGNDLHKACTDNKDFVLGYVGGWADKLSLDRNLVGVVERRMAKEGEGPLSTYAVQAMTNNICIPAKAQLGQLVDLVCKHTTEHPEVRHKVMSILMADALREAFPCP